MRRIVGSEDTTPILPARERYWGSGRVHVQRPTGRRRRVSRRVAPLGAPRASRHRLGEGRLRTPRAMRLLHGARRRRRPGRLRDPGGSGGGAGGHHRRRPRPGGARRARGRVRRSRRIAVRLLHSWDRRARRGPAGEGPWLAGRPRSGARRPPLPLHRLGDRLRGHRRMRPPPASAARGRRCRAQRAGLEGGVPQRVGPEIPLGEGGFADDGASRDALVAVPLPTRFGCAVDRGRRACSGSWPSRCYEARALAAKVQGRRTTADMTWPLDPPAASRRAECGSSPGGWSPRTSSPTRPGANREATPASPLANGGAFGGKESSVVAAAARELADHAGRTVRVVLSREDVVRLGPETSADRRDRGRATAAASDQWRCRRSASMRTPHRSSGRTAIDESGTWEQRSGSRPTDRDAPPRGRVRRTSGACSRAR